MSGEGILRSDLDALHRSGSLRDISEWVLDHAETLIRRNSRPNVPQAYPPQFLNITFELPRYEKNIYDRKEDEYRSGLICHCKMQLDGFNNGFRILDGTGIVVQNGKTSNSGLILYCETHFYEENWPALFVMAKMNGIDGKMSFFLTA